MADLDAHYIRVRDYAERFSMDESTVYKKIERGEIEAIRIGKAVRIPSAELSRYLHPTRTLGEKGVPRDGEPHNLEDRAARFEEATGRSPRDYVAAWRDGDIEDTPEQARLAMEALALRSALEQPTAAKL
jgi:excisionase family DNA binding protein